MMQEKLKLKLVASTRIWHAHGLSRDFPMWQPGGSGEYIIGYFDHEPTLEEVGETVSKFMHVLEGRMNPQTAEVYSGYCLYHRDGLTHNEQFQLQNGEVIDFQAEDVTEIVQETKE